MFYSFFVVVLLFKYRTHKSMIITGNVALSEAPSVFV